MEFATQHDPANLCSNATPAYKIARAAAPIAKLFVAPEIRLGGRNLPHLYRHLDKGRRILLSWFCDVDSRPGPRREKHLHQQRTISEATKLRPPYARCHSSCISESTKTFQTDLQIPTHNDYRSQRKTYRTNGRWSLYKPIGSQSRGHLS